MTDPHPRPADPRPLSPYRAGWIHFTNVAPILDSLVLPPGVTAITGVPTQMNEALLSGAVDIANISAVEFIRQVDKPCVAYKIMGAGRIDPLMAFEYAFENIKPGDVVNVGMHRGDKDDMVEENVAIVRQTLANLAEPMVA